MRYRITGRVQGVGFRYFTRRAAQKEGVRGWVRNVSDGSVEAEALGSDDQLAAFEEAIGRGPGPSRVDGVERSPGDDSSVGAGFEIVL